MTVKPASIPISLTHPTTGYHSRAVLPAPSNGVPIPFDGAGDTPGAAIDQVVEALVNCGHGHNKMWIKGAFIPDPAQIIEHEKDKT